MNQFLDQLMIGNDGFNLADVGQTGFAGVSDQLFDKNLGGFGFGFSSFNSLGTDNRTGKAF